MTGGFGGSGDGTAGFDSDDGHVIGAGGGHGADRIGADGGAGICAF